MPCPPVEHTFQSLYKRVEAGGSLGVSHPNGAVSGSRYVDRRDSNSSPSSLAWSIEVALGDSWRLG